MGLLDFLFGKKPKVQQVPLYNQPQQDLISQLLGSSKELIPEGTDFLKQLLSPDSELMQRFEAPAWRQFNEQIVPSIANRFAGLGGGLNSSAFQQALKQASTQFAENLSAQRGQLGLQGLQSIFPYVQGGLTQQYNQVSVPGTQGIFGGLAQGLAQSPFLSVLQNALVNRGAGQSGFSSGSISPSGYGLGSSYYGGR